MTFLEIKRNITSKLEIKDDDKLTIHYIITEDEDKLIKIPVINDNDVQYFYKSCGPPYHLFVEYHNL